ncbi:hypothetical protein FB45DRAFT_999224 [Roridomyces roridus]|uniref:Rad4/PNGase transglutaminase-like fold domain-containing protein n=1 Tax=Roridomyces roridus TaxID=1738132 RepID=A0AAD7CBD8_9AGAR|nr:hypothetical protein FB45DRAFT_999224 [Roridomyces roridus]
MAEQRREGQNGCSQGQGQVEDVEEEPAVEDPKGKGKAKEASPTFGKRLDGEPFESEKAKPAVKLRKKKPEQNVPSSGLSSSRDPATTPPVFWTEVFSRPDARWIPVDPIRGLVNQPYIFDPSVTTEVSLHTPVANANPGSAYPRPSASTHPGKATKRVESDNRMLYVVALENDLVQGGSRQLPEPSAPSAAAPAGRSLRPRRSKTQTQLEEEEEERERAFQRAVAE